ncbi:MAG: radical SAM protein [Bacilli bacterium]|nr:radical SAM protein [Bacilli bacterium]
MINRVNLIITHKCNLNCKHCYMDLLNQKQLNDDAIYEKTISVVDLLKKEGITEIMFTGGEIFTFSNIKNILMYSKEKGFKNIIFTNALNFDYDCLDYIDQVNISLDGDEKTHNYIRGNQKSYKKVIETLDILKKKDVRTNLQISVNKHNINSLDFLPGLLLEHLNIRNVNLISIIDKGNAANNNIFADSSFDYEVIKLLPKLYEETKYHIQFRTSLISKYDFQNCYINEMPIFPLWIDIVDDDYYVIKNTEYSGKLCEFNITNIKSMCYNIQQKLINKKVQEKEFINVEYEMEHIDS